MGLVAMLLPLFAHAFGIVYVGAVFAVLGLVAGGTVPLVLKCTKRLYTADLIGVGASINTTTAGIFAGATQSIIAFAMVAASRYAGEAGGHGPAAGQRCRLRRADRNTAADVAARRRRAAADEEQADRRPISIEIRGDGMARLYLRKNEVGSNFAVSSVAKRDVLRIRGADEQRSAAFPCVFGVAGYRQDQLRYLFLDPLDVETLGEQLAQFVAECRGYGPNTSLIVFTRPRPVQTLDAYYRKFWLLLDQLARVDKSPWPAEIPEQVDHPMWEFSFAGEPIFVVCSTPAHVMRQSRRASTFMLTFQPRWVFEKILGTEKAANAAFAEVRKRLIPYDGTGPSPLLGRYGDHDGREYQQYFLHDENNHAAGCPFAKLAQGKTMTSKTRSKPHDADHRSDENRFHDRSGHPRPASRAGLASSCSATRRARCMPSIRTRSTRSSMIISGRLKFMWEGGERVCGAATRSSCRPARCTNPKRWREARSTRSQRGRRRRRKELKVIRRQDNVRSGVGSVASRSTNSITSKRCLGASLRNAFKQTKAFDRFARWSSKLLVQLRNERADFSSRTFDWEQ